MIRFVAASLSAAFVASSPVLADGASLGHWCDPMVPQMTGYSALVEIVSLGEGHFEVRYTFEDGSTRVARLQEQPDGTFVEANTEMGEGYRLADSGQLEVFDEMGPIREATRAAGSRLADCNS